MGADGDFTGTSQDPEIFRRIAEELGIRHSQVAGAAVLIDGGNTIPFIARYRKEATENLDDQILRTLSERLAFYRNLQEKKDSIKRLIGEQGLLTEELSARIDACVSVNEAEDLYRPYRPKRKTRASIAMERGLGDLALTILEGAMERPALEAFAARFADPARDVADIGAAIAGARDILAEWMSDDPALRKRLRAIMMNTGTVVTAAKKKEPSVYEMYYAYSEPAGKIAGHRVLAVNRGEREGFLGVKISCDDDFVVSVIFGHCRQGSLLAGLLLRSPAAEKDGMAPAGTMTKSDGRLLPVRSQACLEILGEACTDAWKRLIGPSVETEIRNALTADAEEKAIRIFSQNLRHTLMQPPVRGKTVLGFDPAYRTGCKLAVVDPTGKCLATAVIYPHPPQNRREEAGKALSDLIRRHGADVVAIGNGTASGESERFVADVLRGEAPGTAYCMVNEAGASVYSASELGAKEFPDFDVSLRSAVSIARRLQDPLAELVKIDPRSIGVGQYQHDMNQKRLEASLRGVVEDCVNTVGVDLNTASPSLLSYVAGISPQIAGNIADHRDKAGAFCSRQDLLKIPKLGARAFEQCAGFLRIPGADDFLDNTSVHPESYGAARRLIRLLGDPAACDVKDLAERYGIERLSSELGIGVPTLTDIAEAISRPGRDPRGEEFDMVSAEKPMDISDLREGMVLPGVVRNVSAFGAFVDIGVHQDGLVHISQLSDRFIRDPATVVSAGQKVRVRILGVDPVKKRISLSMKGLPEAP